jgi:4-hydroxy-tetrahydrodipicolinate reductase
MGFPVVVLGAKGRLGQQVVHALHNDRRLHLVAALSRDDAHQLPALLRPQTIVIDVTTAGSTGTTAAACVAAGSSWLVATTGLDDAARTAIDNASQHIAVLAAANLSISAHVAALVVERCAAAFHTADIEVVEMHHRHKRDAPSGTAMMLAEAARSGRHGATIVSNRHTARGVGEIGIAAVRGGDVVGEHTVHFLGDGERIAIQHTVTDRAVFGRGAVEAAVFLAGRSPARYHMRDVVAAVAMG